MKDLLAASVLLVPALAQGAVFNDGFEPFDPCAPSVPPDAAPLSTNTAISASGGNYWVCGSHISVSFSGDGNRIYVDTQNDAIVSGANNLIWSVDQAAVTLFGTSNAVFADPGASTKDLGTGNVTTDCAGLHFDLSSAPTCP